ncbi:hypothetical protein E4T39_03933 [Aureobasidium subglaciale]|nr:hypothetical protein E4T39_03933 [Aureobasidium subglaciale]
MPSIADSINKIKDQMRDHDFARQSHEQTQREHERILDEYDRMTRKRSTRMRAERDEKREDGRERRRSRSPLSMRFRFKDEKGSDGRKSKRRSRHSSHRHGHRSRHDDQDDENNINSHTTPRNVDPATSTSPLPNSNSATSPKDPDTAFRESLFDAMADDEGAAYWQGIYGDSIHAYPRPSVKDPQGHLEQMSDDQYVAYVKTKMWEKKNPEVLRERLARQEAEATSRRRGHDSEDDEYEEDFEWVGSAEKGYEKRSTKSRRLPPRRETRESRHDKAFLSDIDAALARGAKRKETKKYQQAWSAYLQRWQALKTSPPPPSVSAEALLKEIPWPVQSLVSTDVNKQNVEDFFANAPLEDDVRVKTLKDESVNWHPDRFQRRFGGSGVNEETLKLATSVFQTIYEMWERMRPVK